MKGNGFRLLKTDIQHEVENLQQLQRELEWEKLQPLAEKLPEVQSRFENDLQKFYEYLDTLISKAES